MRTHNERFPLSPKSPNPASSTPSATVYQSSLPAAALTALCRSRWKRTVKGETEERKQSQRKLGDGIRRRQQLTNWSLVVTLAERLGALLRSSLNVEVLLKRLSLAGRGRGGEAALEVGIAADGVGVGGDDGGNLEGTVIVGELSSTSKASSEQGTEVTEPISIVGREEGESEVTHRLIQGERMVAKWN